jgi:hypothetical protein
MAACDTRLLLICERKERSANRAESRAQAEMAHLVVAEPPEGVPDEDLASLESTLDLLNESVVVGHPVRASRRLDVGGLDGLPEVGGGEGPRLEPLALAGGNGETERLAENGARGRGLDVALVAEPEDKRAEEEDEGWEEVCRGRSQLS